MRVEGAVVVFLDAKKNSIVIPIGKTPIAFSVQILSGVRQLTGAVPSLAFTVQYSVDNTGGQL
ncbi:MAG: hypothetical protein JKY56_13505 [Kofleriaceae bacterium]|nr:hypothetical protein [Kofleriaceae bacterium]